MKICGLRVDVQEVQGPFCKVLGIKEFSDLIYNGKFHGPSPRCGGPAARTLGAAAPCRCAGSRARWSSPAGRNRERGTPGTRWAAHRGVGSSVAAERWR
jgi:hypothetical protein